MREQILPPLVPTALRLQTFKGFLRLGMLKEAGDELEAVEGFDRLSREVMWAEAELYFATKEWQLLLKVCRALSLLRPQSLEAWIYGAFALRRLNLPSESRKFLLKAELHHGKTAGILHFHLACYECLCGNTDEARRRLVLAYGFDAEWRKVALTESDLNGLGMRRN